MLSDCIIFFGCIALKFNSLRIGFSNDVKARVGRHIDFGRKSLLGLFALEINSRVDVIVLSIFFSQYLVGVYSLFALIVDGCQQLLQVARTLLTPVFSKLLRENSAEVKLDFLRKTKRNTFYISIALSPLIFIIYFMIIALLGKEFSAEYSWLCLFMLVASMAICSGATILDFVINQLGEPSKLTAARIKVLFANCSLNLCLVPSLGIYGAALATSVSFFLYAFLINKETCRPLV
jgi:O-antigen/teichoic acid export membrane protein